MEDAPKTPRKPRSLFQRFIRARGSIDDAALSDAFLSVETGDLSGQSDDHHQHVRNKFSVYCEDSAQSSERLKDSPSSHSAPTVVGTSNLACNDDDESSVPGHYDRRFTRCVTLNPLHRGREFIKEGSECDQRAPLLTSADVDSSSTESFHHQRSLKPKRIKPLKNFGVKTIGQKSSFVYLVNQIFGTGVIAIPRVFTLSGWLPCMVADVFVCLAAWLGTLMTLRCMTLVEGNRSFERRLEYMNIISLYLHRPYYRLIQIMFYLSIFASNVVSIIVVAESCDNILVRLFDTTPSFMLLPYPHLALVRDTSLIYGDGNDTGDHGFYLGVSSGYLITAAVCIPLSLQTMDENMKVQYFSFTVLLITLSGLALSSIWKSEQQQLSLLALFALLYTSRRKGMVIGQNLFNKSRRMLLSMPPVLGHKSYGELMSTFLASYSCVNVIPSWANEMSWNVNVNRVVCQGIVFSCLVYYTFGFAMVSSLPTIRTDNVLQEVLAANKGELLASLLVYAFDLITVAPGILVYCITTRYNLITEWSMASPEGMNQKKAHTQAVFWSSCFPFLLAWLVADSSHFSAFLSWSSLVFSLSVNFIAPLLIFLVACAVSPLSHKNPVINTTKTRLQTFLLNLAGQITAVVANRGLLELPEPAVENDDAIYSDSVFTFRPQDMDADTLSLGFSQIAPWSKYGDNEYCDEPTMCLVPPDLAINHHHSDNPFIPDNLRLRPGRLVPISRLSGTLRGDYHPGLSTHAARTPVFTPRPMKSVEDIHSTMQYNSNYQHALHSALSCYNPPAKPISQAFTSSAMWMESYAPHDPMGMFDESPHIFSRIKSAVGGNANVCRSKRCRINVSSAAGTIQSVKLARRHQWDTIGSRRKEIALYNARLKQDSTKAPEKTLEHIAPLAIKAKHGSKALPLIYNPPAVWSSSNRGKPSKSEFAWGRSIAPKSIFRHANRFATYARSIGAGSYFRLKDEDGKVDLISVKSAFEFRRHHTAAVQHRIPDFPSDIASSECSELSNPLRGRESQRERRESDVSKRDDEASKDQMAIIINSPLSPTPLPKNEGTNREAAKRAASLRAPVVIVPPVSSSGDETSNDTGSCQSRRISLTLDPRPVRSRYLHEPSGSGMGTYRTPSPLSVRFAVSKPDSECSSSYNVTSRPKSHRQPPLQSPGHLEYLELPTPHIDNVPSPIQEDDVAEEEGSVETELISNAEDAYAQDEDLFGELENIRIRVFPKGFLRRNHVEFTVTLLVLLVVSCSATALGKLIELISGGD